jgi:hypothetical protein
MCNYSLTAIPNRLAVSGEELIVYRFEAGSVGSRQPWIFEKDKNVAGSKAMGSGRSLSSFLTLQMLR